MLLFHKVLVTSCETHIAAYNVQVYKSTMYICTCNVLKCGPEEIYTIYIIIIRYDCTNFEQ